MNETQLEKLIVSLEANTAKLDSAIDKSSSLMDRQLSRMESRADSFASRLEKSFSKIGKGGGLGNLGGILAGAVSVAAITGAIESISALTENIETQRKVLGLSAEAWQAWSIIAEKSGVAPDVLSVGLDRFAKNLGDAQLKQTEFGKVAKDLGVNLKGTVEQAFYQYIDGLDRIGSTSQRAAVNVLGFGKGAAGMAGFVGQGSAAIRAQTEALKANGEIISDDVIEKITHLKGVWTDLKAELTTAEANVMAGFATSFHQFAGDAAGSGFQTGLKNFGTILGAAAKDAISLAKDLPAIVGALAGLAVGGPIGAAAGGIAGAEYQHKDDIHAWGVRNIMAPLNDLNIWGAQNGILPGSQLAGFQRQKAQYQNELFGYNANRGGIPGLETPVAGQQPGMDSLLALMHPPAPKGSSVDLSGALQPKAPESAYAKALASIRERIAALQASAKADDDSTEAQERERSALELLTAAQDDAAKHGGTVTAAQKAQIADLSAAYAKLAAAREFRKDLVTEDERITKLAAEGQEAKLTAAALAELQTRQELVAKYHERFGPGAIPATDMASINKTAASAGTATSSSEMGKALFDAGKQSDTVRDQIATLGLFDGALAQAQLRLDLLNKAKEAGADLDAKDAQSGQTLRQSIDQTAEAYGHLQQVLKDNQEALDDQIRLSDELRSGLENIGVAGLKGFSGMRDAARQFLDQLAQLIIKLYVMQPLLDALLGKQGTVGGGLAGGGLQQALGGSTGAGGAGGGMLSQIFSLFGSNTNNAGAFTQALPNGGGTLNVPALPDLSGEIGTADQVAGAAGRASDSGGMIGSALDSIGAILGFAGGGKIRGAGSTRSDSVLMRGSQGEFVVNAHDAAQNLPLLEAINSGRLPSFASGGMVGRIASVPRAGALAKASPSLAVNNNFTVDARGATDGVADQIDAKLRDAAPVIISGALSQFDRLFPKKLSDTLRDRG